MTALLSTNGLTLQTPNGRPLLRDLDLRIAEGERVAIVGRNGVGKTTLLRALSGATEGAVGRVACTGSRLLVSQLSDEMHTSPAARTGLAEQGSPGERRRAALHSAFDAAPSFLFLDEPSTDLDASAMTWLRGALRRYPGGCIVVSHDRRILRDFRDFFVVSEAGCYHHAGDFESLLEVMNDKRRYHERKYVQNLAQHVHEEQAHVRIARRRERKKNVGRIRELGRCSSRLQLNTKRGQAQYQQGRRGGIQAAKIDAAREWVRSVRRALDVELPLNMAWNLDATNAGPPIIDARRLRLPNFGARPGRVVDLHLRHERWAITGANGSGKSTLLRTLLGEQGGSCELSRVDLARVGYVAQNASNWMLPNSLLEALCVDATDLPRAASVVAAHRFPAGLAERPLVSLSPGERVRAALITLAMRQPQVELLVLDEPTNHLDLLATAQLEGVLRAWPGGLLVVSHDREFLDNIGIERVLEL